MAPITFKAAIFAILGGAVPAILWLWFWLREEDEQNPEPRGIIVLSFIIGAIAVIAAIGIEKFSTIFVTDKFYQIVTWASIEEIIKYIGVSLIIAGTRMIKEPIDYPMYFIAVALGFAAFENILFLLHPLSINGTIVGVLTGNLRYLGSTLLHAIASGMVGSALGLAFYQGWLYTKTYLIGGLILAITLHTIFNFFIMKGSGENFLQVFGFLWIVAIINILIFEKLRRMSRVQMATT